MSKNVSDELRRALDDPKTRYRIVDAWVLMQKKQLLEARLATRGLAQPPKTESSPSSTRTD